MKITNKRGFTLVELMIVLFIFSILISFMFPKLDQLTESSKKSANKSNIHIINTQVELWYQQNGTWPADDLSDIGNNPNYFPEGLPINPLDDSNYELDPNTHRVIIPEE